MKFKIEKKVLLPLLRRAVVCTDAKNVREEARMIRLAVAGSELVVTATDFSLQFSGKATATVEREGAVCLEAKGLVVRVDAMPEGWLQIDMGAKRTTIRAAGSKRSFAVEHTVLDYPTLAWGDEHPTLFELPGTALAHLLAAASWCADPSSAQPKLNAVRLFLDRRTLAAEGASTAKGARVVIDLPTEHDLEIPIGLAHAHVLTDFARAVGETVVKVRGTTQVLYLEAVGVSVGVYLPAIGSVSLVQLLSLYDKLEHHEVVVAKKALGESIAALRVAVNEDDIGLHVVVAPDGVHLIAAGQGEGHDLVPTASPIGTPMARRFQAGCLADVVKMTTGDSVSFTTLDGGPQLPAPWLVCETTSWTRSTFLLQPMDMKSKPVSLTDFLTKLGIA